MFGTRRRLRALGRRALRRVWRRPAATILMYHRIAEPPYDPWGLAVSPARFAEQLAWLQRSRRLMHMDQLVSDLRAGKLSRRAVAITFDDGYVDNLRVAKPILARAQAPAIVFITTNRLGAQREFWWDELAHMCLGGTRAVDGTLELVGEPIAIALPARTGATSSTWSWSDAPGSARERTYLQLWKALQRLDEPARETQMDALRRLFGEPLAEAANLPMRRADVAELISGGLVRVGGHAQAHLPLTSLSAPEKRRQIEACKRELEELTHGAISGFAYPFGDCDEEARSLTRAAGYGWAVSTRQAAVDARGYDRFDLPRVQVMNWTGRELMQKLNEVERA